MPSYDVSQTFFCRETGVKYEPGDTADLPEEVAASYARNVPGLLKPARLTTQGSAAAVRSGRPRKAPGRRPRARA